MIHDIALKEIQIHPVSVPLKQPIQTAYGRLTHRNALILELFSKDGTRVYSECSALDDPGYHPETLNLAKQCLETTLIPTVLNRPLTPRTLARDLFDSAPNNPFAIAAIEMGVWALNAVSQNVSLSSLLGSETPGIQPKARVASGYVLGLETTERLAQETENAEALGVHKLKFKVSPQTLSGTLSFIKDYDIFNRFKTVALDANQQFDLETLEHLREVSRLPFSYIEEPFSRDFLIEEPRSRTQIKALFPFPIFLDEFVRSPSELQAALSLPACDGFIIKPAKLGGLQPAMDALALCQSRSKRSVLGGLFETGIGRAYSLVFGALLTATSAPGIAPDLSPSSRYFSDDTAAPIELDSDGYFMVPDNAVFSDDSFRRLRRSS